MFLREHSIFSVVLTEAVAPYYVEAWRRASVNTLEKIECSLRAKITKQMARPKRILKGMKRCGKCKSCPFIKEGRSIKADKFTWSINKPFNCNSSNVVYLLECNKQNCNLRYIGETQRQLKERINEHRGYARNGITSNATGEHFNMPGHSESNMQFTVIEQPKQKDLFYRKEREQHHISKFNTYYKGINREP